VEHFTLSQWGDVDFSIENLEDPIFCLLLSLFRSGRETGRHVSFFPFAAVRSPDDVPFDLEGGRDSHAHLAHESPLSLSLC